MSLKVDSPASKVDGLATKADLVAGLAEMKTDIIKWMIGCLGVQTVIIVGTVLAVARFVSH